MKSIEGLSGKEIERRRKIAENFQERRKKGYARYLKKKHKEMERRKERERIRKEKEKEKKRLKREREKELAKLIPKKKKVGRPKKTGPKVNYYKRRKKLLIEKKKRGRKELPPFNYKIISCRNGIQNKFIGKYRYIEDAYDALNKLKEEDSKVVFQSMVTGVDTLENSIDEYVLIEKSEDKNILLRNEYGKLVEQKINIDGWVILDKFRYRKEETFWVYGYNKRTDRKTFSWIFKNIILNNIDNLYDFKRIIVFRNKIIIKDDNNSMNIIFCKHPSDAVRFYNLVESFVKKDKIKQILFYGDYSERSEKRRKLEDEIIKLTGWTRKKVNMNGSSYFLKK